MPWDFGLDPNSVAYKIAAATTERVRVIAGPGTGKSFAMKRRVARLLESEVAPKKILAVTFTRVAAEDLHRELQKLDAPGCEELEGVTLHSLALRILSRQHALETLGRVPRPLNKFELRTMVCDLCGRHGGKKRTKELIAAYEGAWAQSQGDEPGFPKTDEEKAFQKDMVDWHLFHRSMLIGEVIPYLVRYLKENPLAEEHSEFTHLLVDEYQDLNKAEQTALEYLGTNAVVCIVGDDDQSIYGFKNAHPEGIRTWGEINAGCDDLSMVDCRRCPTTVVEMANSLIAYNTNRVERLLKPIPENGPGEIEIVQLSSLEAEANWIVDRVTALLGQGVHPSEIIILIQRGKLGGAILDALKEAGVPSKSYYEESQLESEAAQVQFAIFKLLIDNEDRVALRYLLGVGTANFRTGPYAKLRNCCEESGDSPWSALEKMTSGELKLPHTRTLVDAFLDIKAKLEILSAVGDNIPDLIDALFPDDELSLSDLRAVALSVWVEGDTAKKLFGSMMKEITQPDIPPTVDEVRLMSLHKSKGLSSPHVFIAACVEGVIPQTPDQGTPKVKADADIEEARRLFFVGITRVKAEPDKGYPGSLFVTYPREMNAGQASGERMSFGYVNYGKAQLIPSRFIQELGPKAPKPKAA